MNNRPVNAEFSSVYRTIMDEPSPRIGLALPTRLLGGLVKRVLRALVVTDVAKTHDCPMHAYQEQTRYNRKAEVRPFVTRELRERRGCSEAA